MQQDDKSNSLDVPVWGARAIGAVINRSERQAFHALESGHLSAEKIGHIWVSTPRRLLSRLGCDSEQAA
jgi:hypothetical protein